MFDAEVLADLRATFDQADADGSGQIDANEACVLFAAFCEPGSSPEQIERTAGNLLSTLDTDRSGKLSFEEFAFRFGRKAQMEHARRRRAGAGPASPSLTSPAAAAAVGVSALPEGAYVRRVAARPETSNATPPLGTAAAARHPPARDVAGPAPSAAGLSRETTIVAGIILCLLALMVFAIAVPASAPGGARTRSGSRARTRPR